MNTFSLTPLFRSTVGFDRFNDLFESLASNEELSNGYANTRQAHRHQESGVKRVNLPLIRGQVPCAYNYKYKEDTRCWKLKPKTKINSGIGLKHLQHIAA